MITFASGRMTSFMDVWMLRVDLDYFKRAGTKDVAWQWITCFYEPTNRSSVLHVSDPTLPSMLFNRQAMIPNSVDAARGSKDVRSATTHEI
jgi:hypothetical protein